MRAYQSSFRWILSIGIFIWIALALLITWAGTLPDPYLIHVRGITTAQPYPVRAIAIEQCIVALSLGLLAWAAMVNRWKRVRRAFGVFVISGAIGVIAGLGVMHAPDHYAYFALSMLVIATVSMLIVVVLTAICLLGPNKAIVSGAEESLEG